MAIWSQAVVTKAHRSSDEGTSSSSVGGEEGQQCPSLSQLWHRRPRVQFHDILYIMFRDITYTSARRAGV
jgi:hypothetical protein